MAVMDSDSFIRKQGKHFQCDICGTRLATDHCVADHIKGKKHRRLVNLKLTREQQAERSIFVGNLQKTTSDLELVGHFSKFGPVSKVIIDKQKSAYAIVEFAEKKSAVCAAEEEKQDMNGLNLVVRPREVKEFVSSGITQRNSALEEKKKREDQQRHKNEELCAMLSEMKSIEEQMSALIKSTCLSPSGLQLRYLICRLLQEVFTEFFPACQVYPYGSSVNGCGSEVSDLDIFVSLNWKEEGWKYAFASLKSYENSPSTSSDIEGAVQSNSAKTTEMEESTLDPDNAPDKEALEFVAQVLQKCVPSCHKVHIIASARTPVVKFVHKESGLHCDIILNNRLSLRNTELVRFYCSMQGDIQALIFTIRRWGKFRHIAENVGPGPRLSNYALTWMVIFFLQTKGIVPTVEELKEKAGPSDLLNIDGWNCSLCLDHSQFPDVQKRVSIGALLKEFFDYYSDMDWSLNCLVPATGKVLPISHLVHITHSTNNEQFKRGPMNIQDPLELCHNTALNVNEKTQAIFSEECKKAAATCSLANFGKRPEGTGDAVSPWGITLLIGSIRKEVSPKKCHPEGNYHLSFQLRNKQLTEEFLQAHSDQVMLKGAWASKMKCFIVDILRDILCVSCKRLTVGGKSGKQNEEDSKDKMETYMEVEEETQSKTGAEEGEPPMKKPRQNDASYEEEMDIVSGKIEQESTIDASDMYTCSLNHEIWVGRRKIRRNLQQSGNTSEGLELEKMVTEKIIHESSRKEDGAIMEFQLEVKGDIKEVATLNLALVPRKGQTSFKLFYHFLEGFLPKLVDEQRF